LISSVALLENLV
jgi:hypothetical protein